MTINKRFSNSNNYYFVFCFADPNDSNIMYDEKSKELNFIDYHPIGWIPRDMWLCLIDPYLIVALEKISPSTKIQKYLDVLLPAYKN